MVEISFDSFVLKTILILFENYSRVQMIFFGRTTRTARVNPIEFLAFDQEMKY